MFINLPFTTAAEDSEHVTGVDCSSGCVPGFGLGGGSDGGFSGVPVAKQKTKDYKRHLGPVAPSV